MRVDITHVVAIVFKPVPARTMCSYVRFVAGRARGDIQTGATWQREFVRSHPEYRRDGVVTPGIGYDLLQEVLRVATGASPAPALVGALAPPRLVARHVAAALSPSSGAGASATAPLARWPAANAASSSGMAPAAAAAATAVASGDSMRSANGSGADTHGNGCAHGDAGVADGCRICSVDGANGHTDAGTAIAERRGGQSGGDAASATAAAAPPSGRSVPIPVLSPSGGVRMRGRSFAEEVKELSSHCIIIQRLLERYSVRPGQRFDDVPAFLP